MIGILCPWTSQFDLPLFNEGPDVKLKGKARPWLRMQVPILVRDGRRVNLPILGHVVHLRPGDIDDPIDDGMRNMHALRTKLPAQALRQRSERELAGREGGEARRSLYRRRRAGEDQRRGMYGLGGRGRGAGRAGVLDCLEQEWKRGAREVVSAHRAALYRRLELVRRDLKERLACPWAGGIEDRGGDGCVEAFDLLERFSH